LTLESRRPYINIIRSNSIQKNSQASYITYIHTYIHTYVHQLLPACLPALPIKPELHHLPVAGSGSGQKLNSLLHSGLLPTKLSSSPHWRFNLLHSAAERRQSENSFALPTVRLVLCALPSSLIAALRLRCTAQGFFCKLYISSSHPHRESLTYNQQ